MNVLRSWKPLIAAGCSHGDLIDPHAREAVLRFCKEFRPVHRIHLGDFVDTAALRSGAKGSKDESTEIEPDFDGGLGFLEEYRATLVFCGNHEDRPFRLRHHHNAIVSHCANALCERIEAKCKKLRAELVQWHILKGWRQIGDFLFGHGYIFNESTDRDSAEMMESNVVVAHWHRTGLAKARTISNSTGMCVGTLANIPNMDYAKARRSTMAWNPGFVWGYASDKHCQLWLHEQPREQKNWVLPV